MATSQTAPASPASRGTWPLDLALAGGALLVFAASALFTPETLPATEVCTLHRLTGLPCPGCGMTRAFCAITHGQFARAWLFNPFSFVFYAAGLGVLTWPAWRRMAPEFEARLVRGRWLLRGALAVLAAMVIYGADRIARVLGGL